MNVRKNGDLLVNWSVKLSWSVKWSGRRGTPPCLEWSRYATCQIYWYHRQQTPWDSQPITVHCTQIIWCLMSWFWCHMYSAITCARSLYKNTLVAKHVKCKIAGLHLAGSHRHQVKSDKILHCKVLKSLKIACRIIFRHLPSRFHIAKYLHQNWHDKILADFLLLLRRKGRNICPSWHQKMSSHVRTGSR